MLKQTLKFIVFFFFSCYATASFSTDKEYSTTRKVLEFEGRGLYQKTALAVSYDSTLILVSPVSEWLRDMKEEHVNTLNANVDLTDLPNLADLLTEGIRHTTNPFLIKLRYTLPDGSEAEKNLPVHEFLTTHGHMVYQLREEISLPTVMENADVIIESWPEPTSDSLNDGLRKKFPTHAVCCNCKGSCAALWVLFGLCTKCFSINGGEYCCSICKMSAAPGGSCD